MVKHLIEDEQVDARDIAERYMFVPLEQPDISTWLPSFFEWHNDYPTYNYVMGFVALSILYLVMILPNFMAHAVLSTVLMLLLPEGKNHYKSWACGEYLSVMVDAAADLHLSVYQMFQLTRRIVGAAIKLLWAFAWQEQALPIFVYNHWVLQIAVALTPAVNAFAIFIAGSPETKLDGTGLYPGADHCNTHSPHALWH